MHAISRNLHIGVNTFNDVFNAGILGKYCDFLILYIYIYTGFWWGNLRERGHWGDPGLDGRIILRWILRIGRSGGHL